MSIMATSDDLKSRLSEICLEQKDQDVNEEKWGLSMKELFRLALHFYKEKSGKAIHLSYEDNIKLVAFTQQATNGPFNSKNAPQLGVLDMIGKDRRVAWQQLGSLSKFQAMDGFISLLDRLCPSFKPYIEAIKKDKEERLKIALEEERKQKEALERERMLQEEQRKHEELRNREEQQRRQLQDALNQQTYHQFKSYAEKQFPGNPEQQASLIRQLQNEHYHQYMQQLHAQLRFTNKGVTNSTTEDTQQQQLLQFQTQQPQLDNNLNNITTNEQNAIVPIGNKEVSCCEEKEQCESEEDSGEYLVISPARMWTRPDIKNFKDEVSAGRGDGVIRVSHGDIVTVRVPTHEGGSCLFWEFATDNYDIGFGVYFEWGKSPTSEVSVHISESDDDDELFDEDDIEEFSSNGDLECGSVQYVSNRTPEQAGRPPISIIIPVYRRECQNEVYVGSHNYPGEGVYLLKFDNSFSIWRSKTLYYRVYYER